MPLIALAQSLEFIICITLLNIFNSVNSCKNKFISLQFASFSMNDKYVYKDSQIKG